MTPRPRLPTCVYCGAQTWLDADGRCSECAGETITLPPDEGEGRVEWMTGRPVTQGRLAL